MALGSGHLREHGAFSLASLHFRSLALYQDHLIASRKTKRDRNNNWGGYYYYYFLGQLFSLFSPEKATSTMCATRRCVNVGKNKFAEFI